MASTSVRRYAQAAFAIAVERDALETWISDLEIARSIFAESDVQAFMSAPSVPESVKLDGIGTLLSEVDPLVRNLVSLLVTNGDIERLAGVCDTFCELTDDHLGIGRALITTAVPLDDARRERIVNSLQELTGYDRIEVSEQVDPEIIGGVVARVGDRLFDGSTRSRLRSMQESLAQRPLSA